MAVLSIYVSDRTMAFLEHAAREHGRSPDDLAESAVEEAALAHAKESGLLDNLADKES